MSTTTAHARANAARANAEHMRRAALRNAADPARRAKAVRTVAAALDLGLVTLDDVIEAREAHQRRGA